VLARWLRERGLDAQALETRYEGERDDATEEAGPDDGVDAGEPDDAAGAVGRDNAGRAPAGPPR
jgi:hypothetical protein